MVIFSNLWGHPTSLLADPSRAPLTTHTSNNAALSRLPNKELRGATTDPFQTPNQTATQSYQLPFSGLARQSQFIPINQGLVYSDQSKTTHQPSEPNKRRPPGPVKPVWLRASCNGGLTAQLKAEKLIVVPSTANGFIAAVSALRSIDGGRV